jgi:hypothetical protein
VSDTQFGPQINFSVASEDRMWKGKEIVLTGQKRDKYQKE